MERLKTLKHCRRTNKTSYPQTPGFQRCFWIPCRLLFCAPVQSLWVWCGAVERSCPGALCFQAAVHREPHTHTDRQQSLRSTTQWQASKCWTELPGYCCLQVPALKRNTAAVKCIYFIVQVGRNIKKRAPTKGNRVKGQLDTWDHLQLHQDPPRHTRVKFETLSTLGTHKPQFQP